MVIFLLIEEIDMFPNRKIFLVNDNIYAFGRNNYETVEFKADKSPREIKENYWPAYRNKYNRLD